MDKTNGPFPKGTVLDGKCPPKYSGANLTLLPHVSNAKKNMTIENDGLFLRMSVFQI